MRPASGVRNFPGVVFLKYGGGIFENIPEKCGIFVICRSFVSLYYVQELGKGRLRLRFGLLRRPWWKILMGIVRFYGSDESWRYMCRIVSVGAR